MQLFGTHEAQAALREEVVSGAELQAEGGHHQPGCCHFPGRGLLEEKSGPRSPVSSPWLCSLPKQSESDSRTIYCPAAGDFCTMEPFLTGIHQGSERLGGFSDFPQNVCLPVLLWCWLLPPGTYQCGYF